MTNPADHNKIIAAAAREALAPIGMHRKGRSRTWLLDRAWWLGIVEFQPSAWARGTYLNVSMMWLWQPIDYLTFEVEPRRVGNFVDFDQAPDLPAAIGAVALDAQRAMTHLAERFGRLSLVINYLQTAPRHNDPRYLAHLATAHGLAGTMAAARATFDQAVAAREELTPAPWRATTYLLDARQAATSQAQFRTRALTTIGRTRAALKLPPNPGPLPDHN